MSEENKNLTNESGESNAPENNNSKKKKAIIIGDRDGIPGPAIAECVQTAGAEIVFSSTECFV